MGAAESELRCMEVRISPFKIYAAFLLQSLIASLTLCCACEVSVTRYKQREARGSVARSCIVYCVFLCSQECVKRQNTGCHRRHTDSILHATRLGDTNTHTSFKQPLTQTCARRIHVLSYRCRVTSYCQVIVVVVILWFLGLTSSMCVNNKQCVPV